MSFCYFGLETSGKSKNEIIQIGAVGSRPYHPKFDVYIYPEGSISKYCTENVHGIKKAHGTLFKDGEELDDVMDLEDALEDFFDFLYDNFVESTGEGAILVAHNAFGFDAPILVEHLQQIYEDDVIEEYISGFCDTSEAIQIESFFPVAKKSLKNLKKSCGLGSDPLSDALQDSIDLMRVVQKLTSGRCSAEILEWQEDFLMSSFRPIASFL